LIIEVLSPSTAKLDLGDKAAEFLRIPNLAGYLVFAQDERKAWTWVRGSTGLSPAPNVVEGGDSVVEIPALGNRLTLSDVYDRVELD
jgi:Uma2 family endonuclease